VTDETGEHQEARVSVENTRRVLLLLSYAGGSYSGFARQTNAVTVAGKLEEAISAIDPQASAVTASSRTDAGVHARNQPVSFTTVKSLSSRGWVLALTQRLPDDIAVARASFVPLAFDPRRDPLWKRYRYRLFCSQVEDPFLSPVSWRIGEPLDRSAMEQEAAVLIGEHDFAAFRSVDDVRIETVRKLERVEIQPSPHSPESLDIVVQGNRFMYNMVRIIAGTLVDVGRGRKAPGACARAFVSKDRRELGMTAPARGLQLEHVELREWGTDEWPSRSTA
jgi:tRNA pseudouridine38-40 synthase